jgi:probable rRNA maturation factor
LIHQLSRPNDIITVDVVADEWITSFTDKNLVKKLVISAAKSALSTIGPTHSVEVSVLLTDDKEIRALNQSYRDKDMPTNVLSFAISEYGAPSELSPAQPEGFPTLLGDVVVAYETCSKEADSQSRTLGDYLCHMIIHGTLHLLGYDHNNEKKAIIMEEFERKSLTPLGIKDPYINIGK